MSYITPVTDRVLSDVTNRTTKGFFNIADWNRIYNNAQLASGLASIQKGVNIPFGDCPATRVITDIPSATHVNTLLQSIELMRQEMVSLIPTLTTVIKYD